MEALDRRYPIGRVTFAPDVTPELRREWIEQIRRFPADFRATAAALAPPLLDTPYREGGWTARQVIHHVADSHLNAYVRFRWTLTEDRPAIKTYDEEAWAALADARTADPAPSLALIDAVHTRLHLLLSSLGPAEFARTAVHPEWGAISVDWLLQMYAWHGRHHRAHLELIGR